MCSKLSKAIAVEIICAIRSSVLESMEENSDLEWDEWDEEEGGVAWLDNELSEIEFIDDYDWSSYSTVEDIQKKLEGFSVDVLKMIRSMVLKNKGFEQVE